MSSRTRSRRNWFRRGSGAADHHANATQARFIVDPSAWQQWLAALHTEHLFAKDRAVRPVGWHRVGPLAQDADPAAHARDPVDQQQEHGPVRDAGREWAAGHADGDDVQALRRWARERLGLLGDVVRGRRDEKARQMLASYIDELVVDPAAKTGRLVVNAGLADAGQTQKPHDPPGGGSQGTAIEGG